MRVAMRFPTKMTSSCIWVAIPVDWVILHWYACGADGRLVARAVYGHVITKFSNYGAPQVCNSRTCGALLLIIFLIIML